MDIWSSKNPANQMYEISIARASIMEFFVGSGYKLQAS